MSNLRRRRARSRPTQRFSLARSEKRSLEILASALLPDRQRQLRISLQRCRMTATVDCAPARALMQRESLLQQPVRNADLPWWSTRKTPAMAIRCTGRGRPAGSALDRPSHGVEKSKVEGQTASHFDLFSPADQKTGPRPYIGPEESAIRCNESLHHGFGSVTTHLSRKKTGVT